MVSTTSMTLLMSRPFLHPSFAMAGFSSASFCPSSLSGLLSREECAFFLTGKSTDSSSAEAEAERADERLPVMKVSSLFLLPY
jgi:hypothetical protein